MEAEEQKNVVWNFDDNESKLIFDMKLNFIKFRDNWQLEEAYWALLRLLSEAEPLFEEAMQQELKEDFDKVSKFRKNVSDNEELTNEEKSEYWNNLNSFYRKICNEMVEKDYYFRKKKQYLGL